MIRFFVIESNHLCLNLRFDVDAIYLRLIIISVTNNVLIDSDIFFD
jgi:hypothetical protein